MVEQQMLWDRQHGNGDLKPNFRKFGTQHHRKCANQRELSNIVGKITRYGVVIVALAEASEETRVKMMSKLPYNPEKAARCRQLQRDPIA